MNPETQIKALNLWCNAYLAPSEIHGIGVFANHDLKEGERLYLGITSHPFQVPYNELKDSVPAYIHDQIIGKWPRITENEPFVFPDCVYTSFMNHADEPNYDGDEDVALRDIKAGEEITEDYRLIDNWEEIYPWLK